MDEEKLEQVAAKRVEGKVHFYKHLAVYIAVMFLLFVINHRTSPDYYWFVWPLLGWGIAVAIHGAKVFTNAESSKIKQRMIENEIRRIKETDK